jgi:putative membrane protein
MIMASAFSLPTLAVMLLVPLVLVSLDFVIDPIAVNINKSWQWDSGSAYFGIPWQNFLGWYLVGLVAMVPYLLWEGMKPLVFHPLLILPVAFYAAVPPIGKLIKLDKVNGILGSIPVVLWVTLSAIGLVILYFR